MKCGGAGDGPSGLAKGRKGYEEGIRYREISAGEGFGWGDGERRFGGVSGRRGCETCRRAARRISKSGDYRGRRFFRALGEGNCAARGGKSAEAGAAAGFARDGVSAARVAGAAEDSAGQDTHLYASGPGAGEPAVRAGGGEGARDHSALDCRPLP